MVEGLSWFACAGGEEGNMSVILCTGKQKLPNSPSIYFLLQQTSTLKPHSRMSTRRRADECVIMATAGYDHTIRYVPISASRNVNVELSCC